MIAQDNIVSRQPASHGSRAARGAPWLTRLIYGLVALLVTVRFFTETVPVLPRFLNAIDLLIVPLLLPLYLIWAAVRKKWKLAGKWTIILIGLFMLSWLLAWLLNLEEVHWLGAFLFIVGLLTPIVFYMILINIDLHPRFYQRLLHLLFALLLANLLIGTIQAAQGIGKGTHDFIFGTFGVNQNQLAFFLAFMVTYLLATWRYQGLNLLKLCVLGWSGLLFLLCGFQTLWVILAVAIALMFFFSDVLSARLWAGRIPKRFLSIIALVVLASTLALSFLRFDRFNVPEILSQFITYSNQLGKVKLLQSVPQVWASRPWAFWLGVGPGTFNSRAFRSIAIIPYGTTGATDVAGALVAPFYTSELSNRFIIPYFTRGVFFLSGANTDGPFTSYVSVPVEVGLFGALALFGIYGMVTLALIRSLRRSTDSQERLLAAWALMNMLMLLGIATVDNYLEVTRYTLLVWLSVGIWHIYSRRGAESNRSWA